MSSNRHTLSDPNDPRSSTLGEDCRARPGYYTDGLPKISDEIVEKAWRKAQAHPPESKWYVRAALESVLPDIERPLREEIERLTRDEVDVARVDLLQVQLAERDKEIHRLDGGIIERDKEIERLKHDKEFLWQRVSDQSELLVERDKQVDRLRSSENKEIVRLTRERDEWQATAEALEDPLSRETLLEDENKEIERLQMWERIWREKLAERDKEVFRLRVENTYMKDTSPALGAENVRLHDLLAERDKEIGRLKGMIQQREQRWKRGQIALAERTFSSAGIKALLKLASEGDDGYLSDEEYVALESAMEKMRDE